MTDDTKTIKLPLIKASKVTRWSRGRRVAARYEARVQERDTLGEPGETRDAGYLFGRQAETPAEAKAATEDAIRAQVHHDRGTVYYHTNAGPIFAFRYHDGWAYDIIDPAAPRLSTSRNDQGPETGELDALYRLVHHARTAYGGLRAETPAWLPEKLQAQLDREVEDYNRWQADAKRLGTAHGCYDSGLCMTCHHAASGLIPA